LDVIRFIQILKLSFSKARSKRSSRVRWLRLRASVKANIDVFSALWYGIPEANGEIESRMAQITNESRIGIRPPR